MTVIERDARLTELRRLGLSKALIQLAAGECLHRVFKDVCLGPPHYVYHRAKVPAGPALVPLWERDMMVAGVWLKPGGVEFIEFSAELPEGLRRLAGTEQGFWATRFDHLYESDVSQEDLHAAADEVGFRFLERLLVSREAAEDGLNSFLAHQAWLQDLVAGIDQDALGAGKVEA
ncbi:hypothetical protein [Stenotrophomonas pigmentata]|uniref:hypothetical protein n=1 Tax=Stenotrophomonas pigmentata TaxID=3055080 RepID=UPI0026EE6073|nr:hypothetical protein [Stenotrophomonas sp. 610A2]